MNDLQEYQDRVVQRKPATFVGEDDTGGEAGSNLVAAILRRWYIVLIVFIVVFSLAVTAIWFAVKPSYSVTGAIRVAPILANVLTGEADRGEISNYQSFMNTQAAMIKSDQVVQRVADELAGKKLSFFEDKPTGPFAAIKEKIFAGPRGTDYAAKLKAASRKGIIRVEPGNTTELIKITVTSPKPEEGKQIADAFITAYMSVEGLKSIEGENRKLSLLESESRSLSEKMQAQHEAIRQLAEEYGTDTLDGRQDMMLQRVASLLTELTRVESEKMMLEAKLQQLDRQRDSTLVSDDTLQKRNEYINEDLTVQELTRHIVELEQDLIAAKQTLAPANPVIRQKQEFLDAFRSRLEERRNEVAKNFDDMMARQLGQAAREKRDAVQAQLDQTTVYETLLRKKLSNEDTNTIELGRKQLAIQDMQYQLQLNKEMYDTYSRRIRELEMERKRPARVSVAYNADISSVIDKRVKYTLAAGFASIALGMLLALLRDKADRSLYSPEDVVRRIGIRIIGTTTSPRAIKKALLPRQLVEDYQTIRANLGLLDGGVMPARVVITSPGMRDGKTTFAVNLATSMAKASKKVLLVDGDLRKPDIGALLDLPRHARCLQDFLLGAKVREVVFSMPSVAGLDVLAGDSRDFGDVCEILSSPEAIGRIETLSRNYDHVIIDTPPVLAFPDALLWARFAGAVVLASFAGRTTADDLKEAKEKLTAINVRVLGTVLSNVAAEHNYYRYGYSYYSQDHRRRKSPRASRPLLLGAEKPAEKKQKNKGI